MIDGLKISIPNNVRTLWLEHKKLCFRTVVNEQSGEIMDNTTYALNQGLVFKIKQSKVYQGKHFFEVVGSLHRYWNKGKDNANDFDFRHLCACIDSFQIYGINPETATLHNLEYGLNIEIPLTAKRFFNTLISHKGIQFYELDIKGTKGKKIEKRRFTLKIYDKAKQCKVGKNLIRVELHFKRMETLKPHGIITLSDLKDLNKLAILQNLLLQEFENIIFSEVIDYRKLSNFEQKKLLRYENPNVWNKLTRKQRYRAKKHYTALKSKYGLSDLKYEIQILLIEKYKKMTAKNSNNWVRLEQDFDNANSKYLGTFGQYEYRNHLYPKKEIPESEKYNQNSISETNKNQSKFSHQKNRKCKVCKSDISHKHHKAVFCSKTCNNQFHGKKRNQRQKDQRQTENRQLATILELYKTNSFWLSVTYTDENKKHHYTDCLHQSEICTTKETIRLIKWVEVQTINKATIFKLTQARARKLIRIINQQNI